MAMTVLAAAVAMIDYALPEIMQGATDEDGWPVLKTVAAALARMNKEAERRAGVQSGQPLSHGHRQMPWRRRG
jgi:hypothetical protein